MAHGRNKYQSRANRAKVRQVLMEEWDPIGVCGVSEAQDEYDDYIGRVYAMLMEERASSETIGEYLYRIATEHMGLSPRRELPDRCAQTAEILVGLRPEFELH
jgi:hypothetical protein